LSAQRMRVISPFCQSTPATGNKREEACFSPGLMSCRGGFRGSGNPGWFVSLERMGIVVKKLIGCLVLGLTFAITNVGVIGCKGEEKKTTTTTDKKTTEDATGKKVEEKKVEEKK